MTAGSGDLCPVHFNNVTSFTWRIVIQKLTTAAHHIFSICIKIFTIFLTNSHSFKQDVIPVFYILATTAGPA